MHLWRRDLPRSPTKRAQLQAPSAPTLVTGQGSPPAFSQGSSSSAGTLTAILINRLFWKLNLMLFIPCLHSGGMVLALPSPLFYLCFTLVLQIVASPSAQVRTLRVLLGTAKVLWKETPWQHGDRRDSPQHSTMPAHQAMDRAICPSCGLAWSLCVG